MGSYEQARARAAAFPVEFWAEAAQLVTWGTPPTQVLDASRAPLYRWYPDATLNTSVNALDRHVDAGRGEKIAIYYDSPVTGVQQSITYAELLDDVSRFAGVLAGLGVTKGDRVLLYMSMVPQAVVAMLACARLGAVHSVVFGGFAPAALAGSDRRRHPPGDRVHLLRHRGRPSAALQAHARRGHHLGSSHP